MERLAYLDHAATTPMFPEAKAALAEALGRYDANPSSPHAAGRAARRALDDARDELAEFVGCRPGELVLTSGGTEADNLAIEGVGAPEGAIVVSAIEHHAVLAPAARHGALVARVDVDGVVDLEHLAGLLSEHVVLVSVMAVNNEVGSLQPLDAIADLVAQRAPGALLHTDAVQAAPWCDVAALAARFDLVSISAHKFGGPTGLGALVVREAARGRLAPLLRGGAQEFELRAGTENLPGAIAAAAAARRWGAERLVITERVGALRDRLEDVLAAAGARPNSARSRRIASIAPVGFRGVATEELLFGLDRAGVAASAGAACASGALEPSHVLMAMGLPPESVAGSIRLSLGWTTSTEEVEHAAAVIPEVVTALRDPEGSR